MMGWISGMLLFFLRGGERGGGGVPHYTGAGVAMGYFLLQFLAYGPFPTTIEQSIVFAQSDAALE